MQQYLTVSDIANRLKVSPRLVSELLYSTWLREKSTLLAGRRVISESYFPAIKEMVEWKLQRRKTKSNWGVTR